MIDLFLNATAITRQACRRRYQVQCLWGYDLPSSPEAGFGSEFHMFAEYMAKNPDADTMDYFTQVGQTKDRDVIKLCLYYHSFNPFKGYPILTDSQGVLTAEYKFAFPYAVYEDYRIILCGTIDRIDLDDGVIRVIDHKTARSVKIKDVLTEYEMHFQIPFYLWIFKNFLLQGFPKDIQDAVNSGKFYGQYNGVFLSFEPVKFELSKPISLTADLDASVKRMVDLAIDTSLQICPDSVELEPPTGMVTQSCKYCLLNKLCPTHQDKDIYQFLKGLTSKPYDPRTWR